MSKVVVMVKSRPMGVVNNAGSKGKKSSHIEVGSEGTYKEQDNDYKYTSLNHRAVTAYCHIWITGWVRSFWMWSTNMTHISRLFPPFSIYAIFIS